MPLRHAGCVLCLHTFAPTVADHTPTWKFAENVYPYMKIAFSAKLALALISGIFADYDKINIGNYFRGKYDMDFVFEKFEDIKAAINDPANSVYPYSDPEVHSLIAIGAQAVENRIANTRVRARALGNENMRFSEYLLQSGINIDTLIDQLTIHHVSLDTYSEQSNNSAMKEYLSMNDEGLMRSILWLIQLQQRQNFGARTGYEKLPLEY